MGEANIFLIPCEINILHPAIRTGISVIHDLHPSGRPTAVQNRSRRFCHPSGSRMNTSFVFLLPVPQYPTPSSAPNRVQKSSQNLWFSCRRPDPIKLNARANRRTRWPTEVSPNSSGTNLNSKAGPRFDHSKEDGENAGALFGQSDIRMILNVALLRIRK